MSTDPISRTPQNPTVREFPGSPPASERVIAPAFLAPLGRLLLSAIFIISSFGHFKSQTIAFAAQQGVPMASIAVPLSGVMALVGGLCVLLGFQARIGAWLLVLFLIPVTFTMHRFWGLADPAAAQMQQINFMKNMAMLGGVLLVAYFGAGPMSLDSMRRRPQAV